MKMAASRSSLHLAKQIGVRQFSASSAVRGKLAKPALQIYGIEGRYAHALYSAASKKNALDKVEADIARMKGLMKTDTRLSTYILDPVINKKVKQEVLEKALQAQKFNDLVVNLFGALAENSRLAKTDGIINAFGKLMSSHRGEIQCTITTAKPIEKSQLTDLSKALGGFIKKEETLKVDTKTDAALIGGMVVDIGEYHIDMSIASKVKKLTKSLRGAI